MGKRWAVPRRVLPLRNGIWRTHVVFSCKGTDRTAAIGFPRTLGHRDLAFAPVRILGCMLYKDVGRCGRVGWEMRCRLERTYVL